MAGLAPSDTDPLAQYAVQVDQTIRHESDLKQAAEGDKLKQGLSSVSVNAAGEMKVSGHRDYLNKIVADATEAPVLRAQLSKINDVLAQQLDKVNQQEQFVSSHPILAVLARVSGVAAQDPRMPPIVRGLGAAAQTAYPTPQQTGAEKLGILREMLASAGREQQSEAMSQRLAMQISQLDERERHAMAMENLGSQNLALRGQHEADYNQIQKQRNEISSQREKDSKAWHDRANEIRAMAENTRAGMLKLHQDADKFKQGQKGATTDLTAAKSVVDEYNKKEKEINMMSKKISDLDRGIVIGDEDKAKADRQDLVGKRDELQAELNDLKPLYESAKQVRAKHMAGGGEKAKADDYKSLDDLKKAVDAKKLSRDEAIKIARDRKFIQ